MVWGAGGGFMVPRTATTLATNMAIRGSGIWGKASAGGSVLVSGPGVPDSHSPTIPSVPCYVGSLLMGRPGKLLSSTVGRLLWLLLLLLFLFLPFQKGGHHMVGGEA